MIIAGIDEAGRGCLLGPLVICLATIDTDSLFNENYYKALGIKDSKLLTPQKRKDLYRLVKNNCKFEIASAQPAEIDDAVNRETYNLNWLEADKTVALINNNPNIEKVVIDCPSPNTYAYREYIYSRLNKEIEVICEHKADVNYIEVSLASVIAKHARDTYIKRLHKQHGDFGSGYPGSPLTQKFLKENKDSPIIRKSWSSYKKLFPASEQQTHSAKTS